MRTQPLRPFHIILCAFDTQTPDEQGKRKEIKGNCTSRLLFFSSSFWIIEILKNFQIKRWQVYFPCAFYLFQRSAPFKIYDLQYKDDMVFCIMLNCKGLVFSKQYGFPWLHYTMQTKLWLGFLNLSVSTHIERKYKITSTTIGMIYPSIFLWNLKWAST